MEVLIFLWVAGMLAFLLFLGMRRVVLGGIDVWNRPAAPKPGKPPKPPPTRAEQIREAAERYRQERASAAEIPDPALREAVGLSLDMRLRKKLKNILGA